MNSTLIAVTDRILSRSQETRAAYLERMHRAEGEGPTRGALSCSNLAHGFAACGSADKSALAGGTVPNIAIVSAYNDMLSAHQAMLDLQSLLKKKMQTADSSNGIPDIIVEEAGRLNTIITDFLDFARPQQPNLSTCRVEEIIDKNLARLIHLVSDLFDFTKIEGRKTEWSFDQVNLSVLIEEVLEITDVLVLQAPVDLDLGL